MLDLLRRRSDISSGTALTALTDAMDVDLSEKSRRDPLWWLVLIMVERLLVREGTSTETRMSGPVSAAKELTVRLSVIDEAEVPRREVSKEP